MQSAHHIWFDFGLDHIICCACVFLFLFSLFVRLNSVDHGCLAPGRSAHQSPLISTSACVTVLFLLNFAQIKQYAFVETHLSVIWLTGLYMTSEAIAWLEVGLHRSVEQAGERPNHCAVGPPHMV